VTGRVHGQSGNLSVTRKPTGNLFRTRDGWLVLAVMTEPQFQRLMREIGRPEALADPRFKDWPTRIANGPALHAIVEEALGTATAAEWAERFAGVDAPSAQVLSIPEVVKLEQIGTRDALQEIATEWGPVRLMGSGFRLGHGSGSVDRAPPVLGQHNDEILGELGYDAASIEQLRGAAVI